jgi:hypothetical protein
LNHAKHETLARTFFDLFDEALMYDFDLADAGVGVSHFGDAIR